MRPTGSPLARPGVEQLEDRTVPTHLLTGHQCLVFYLGVAPQTNEFTLEGGTFDPTAASKVVGEAANSIR